MKDFNYYLENLGEIGYVESVLYSIVYVSGLPKVHPDEIVIFETGDIGQVLYITNEISEILLLTITHIRVGSKVVRTNGTLRIPIGMDLLGRVINPLGSPMDNGKPLKNLETSTIDKEPPKILDRKQVIKPFSTGVAIVDMVVPLGVGQRELVIGDRKTGKTEFLMQVITNQASLGTICIYAIIGQKTDNIKYNYYRIEFFGRIRINFSYSVCSNERG